MSGPRIRPPEAEDMLAHEMGRSICSVSRHTRGVPSGLTVRQEMRARVVEGAPRKVIAHETGRTLSSVFYHTRGVRSAVVTGEQAQARSGLAQRAERLERLFSACTRALEAHP